MRKLNNTNSNKGFDAIVEELLRAGDVTFTELSSTKTTSKNGVEYVTIKGNIGNFPFSLNLYNTVKVEKAGFRKL